MSFLLCEGPEVCIFCDGDTRHPSVSVHADTDTEKAVELHAVWQSVKRLDHTSTVSSKERKWSQGLLPECQNGNVSACSDKHHWCGCSDIFRTKSGQSGDERFLIRSCKQYLSIMKGICSQIKAETEMSIFMSKLYDLLFKMPKKCINWNHFCMFSKTGKRIKKNKTKPLKAEIKKIRKVSRNFTLSRPQRDSRVFTIEDSWVKCLS